MCVASRTWLSTQHTSVSIHFVKTLVDVDKAVAVTEVVFDEPLGLSLKSLPLLINIQHSLEGRLV